MPGGSRHGAKLIWYDFGLKVTLPGRLIDALHALAGAEGQWHLSGARERRKDARSVLTSWMVFVKYARLAPDVDG